MDTLWIYFKESLEFVGAEWNLLMKLVREDKKISRGFGEQREFSLQITTTGLQDELFKIFTF